MNRGGLRTKLPSFFTKGILLSGGDSDIEAGVQYNFDFIKNPSLGGNFGGYAITAFFLFDRPLDWVCLFEALEELSLFFLNSLNSSKLICPVASTIISDLLSALKSIVFIWKILFY